MVRQFNVTIQKVIVKDIYMNMKKMKIGESVKTNNVLINTTSRTINVLDSAVVM